MATYKQYSSDLILPSYFVKSLSLLIHVYLLFYCRIYQETALYVQNLLSSYSSLRVLSLNKQHNLTWFSHLGEEYEVRDKVYKKIIQFKDTEKTFDWDNCSFQIARSPAKKLRIFIRGHQHRYSDYKKKIVKPTFLLTIDVNSISTPTEDKYQIGAERKDLKSLHFRQYSRYVFQLDNRYWIWEWKKNYGDIKQSKVYAIYEQIKSYLDNIFQHERVNPDTILATFPHDDKEMIPVIYQPAIDQLKNFVREIHCSKISDDNKCIFVEVSIIFNNEQLRRHKILNSLYEKFRLFFYGRIIDIETFRVCFGDTQDKEGYFTFERIYSGDSGIIEDNIHGDNKSPLPKRNISNNFIDPFHPVVFINTANHAMAEKDNNTRLWKWEYQPFEEKSPVIFGTKSRKEIDSHFMPIIARMVRWIKSRLCSYK